MREARVQKITSENQYLVTTCFDNLLVLHQLLQEKYYLEAVK